MPNVVNGKMVGRYKEDEKKRRKRVTPQQYVSAHNVSVHPDSPRQPTSPEWRQIVKSIRKLPQETRKQLKAGEFRLFLTHGQVEKLTGDKRNVMGLAYEREAYAEILPEWSLVVPHEIGHEVDFATRRTDEARAAGESRRHHIGGYARYLSDTRAEGDSGDDFMRAVRRGYKPNWKQAFEAWSRTPVEVWAVLYSMYSSGREGALPPPVRDYFDQRFGGM
jgi:hypothetical protein